MTKKQNLKNVRCLDCGKLFWEADPSYCSKRKLKKVRNTTDGK